MDKKNGAESLIRLHELLDHCISRRESPSTVADVWGFSFRMLPAPEIAPMCRRAGASIPWTGSWADPHSAGRHRDVCVALLFGLFEILFESHGPDITLVGLNASGHG